MKSRTILMVSGGVVGLYLGAACTDEGEDDVGTGGASTEVTISSASTASGSTTSSSSAGGGGGGGGGATCLAADATNAYFTVEVSSLCAVEKWTAADLTLDPYGASPTWGTHGGPLTYEGTATDVTLSRWAPGAQPGTLEATTSSAAVTVPAGAFWGAQALDVSSSLTVVAWSGMDFTTEGGFAVVKPTGVVQEDALGVFGLGISQGRLLFTGISAAASTTAGDVGLRSALVTSSALTDDGTIATWGLATGPVAVDKAGNAFAVNTDYLAATQELRGFLASDIGPGDAPTPGEVLATLPDFGDAMAALAPPTPQDPGLVLLQPNDGMTFAHLDVVGVPYTVYGGELTMGGPPMTVLALAQADTNLTLMTDDTGRLWVGASNAEGGSGAVFFVLDRVP